MKGSKHYLLSSSDDVDVSRWLVSLFCPLYQIVLGSLSVLLFICTYRMKPDKEIHKIACNKHFVLFVHTTPHIQTPAITHTQKHIYDYFKNWIKTCLKKKNIYFFSHAEMKRFLYIISPIFFIYILHFVNSFISLSYVLLKPIVEHSSLSFKC